MNTNNLKTALITGASRGLGLSLAHAIADKGWNLIINARKAKQLLKAQHALSSKTKVEAISGDVIDEIHLLHLLESIAKLGGLDLLVTNASTLGASPQPQLLDFPVEAIHTVFHTNVIAPLSLLQKVKSHLKPDATIINLSSDAAVEAYEGWGGYGASKAALDHLTAILSRENPQWHIYAFDPGDMRTQMHQEAFPGEDISDRPLPEDFALPAILQLLEHHPPSGSYQAKQLIEEYQMSNVEGS